MKTKFWLYWFHVSMFFWHMRRRRFPGLTLATEISKRGHMTWQEAYNLCEKLSLSHYDICVVPFLTKKEKLFQEVMVQDWSGSYDNLA